MRGPKNFLEPARETSCLFNKLNNRPSCHAYELSNFP